MTERYVLVPVEPTEDMVNAASPLKKHLALAFYRASLAARPKEVPEEVMEQLRMAIMGAGGFQVVSLSDKIARAVIAALAGGE